MSELSNEERLQLRIRELENELKTAKSVLVRKGLAAVRATFHPEIF